MIEHDHKRSKHELCIMIAMKVESIKIPRATLMLLHCCHRAREHVVKY
jgi:hypothetical protein